MDKLKVMTDYLASEEGEKHLTEYCDSINRREVIGVSQLKRLKKRDMFGDFIEKVMTKYNSETYRNRYYNKGIEPPEVLYWFLFDFVERYGRKCTGAEYERYGNMFTSRMYYYEGYYLGIMNGQGSSIQIYKKA